MCGHGARDIDTVSYTHLDVYKRQGLGAAIEAEAADMSERQSLQWMWNGFFDLLGEERCAQITLVSADGAEWIGDVVAERAKNATLCIDSFHVVSWATDALDEVRREVWNTARRSGMKLSLIHI